MQTVAIQSPSGYSWRVSEELRRASGEPPRSLVRAYRKEEVDVTGVDAARGSRHHSLASLAS
eukprot:3835281-Alexandrium_andersonii.AAC.1